MCLVPLNLFLDTIYFKPVKMKWISKISFSIVFWSVLLVSSCMNSHNNTSSNSDNTQISKLSTVANISTSNKSPVLNAHEIIGGWLKVQTKQQVVLNKLGEPEKKGDDQNWGATGTFIQNWEYKALGIILEMESERQDGAKKVFSISIEQPCKLTTSQNVGIGSSAKTIKEKYNTLIDESSSGKDFIVVGSIYGVTAFTLKNGVVCKIFIGAIAE
jgi:hypothetical protein